MREQWKTLAAVAGVLALVWIVSRGKATSDTIEAIGLEPGGTVNKWETPPQGRIYEPLFLAATDAYGLPAGLLSRMAYQESNYDRWAESPMGAQGIMQFMPATAAEWRVNPWEPASAIDGAGRYMKWLYAMTGSWEKAIAAYNFGIGNVTKGRTWPAETVAYVSRIVGDIFG
jgi:soluble lytic murein transglycosylase-like protein